MPNPFRSLSRVLPGRGSSEASTSQEVPAEEPAASSSSEPIDRSDDATTTEHDSAEEEKDTGPDDGPREIDASDTPAPSIGPHTTITQEDAETRLARHEQSDVDAMGLDKRREVIGGSYSPSFAKQATLYGLFVLVVGLLVVGAILAVNEFDQPPKEEKLEAPWKDSTDPAEASEIDFPPDSAPEQVPRGPDPTSSGGSDSA